MSAPKDEFRTFVFRIIDAEAARSTLDPLMASFRGDRTLPGVEVTGVSMEDEMSRCEIAETSRGLLRA